MNPISYSDIFDFSNASEVEKFVRAVGEMEKALADLEKRALEVNKATVALMKQNAVEAEKAAKAVASASKEQIRELAEQADALKKSNDEAKKSAKESEQLGQTLGELRKRLSQLKAAYDVNSNSAEEMSQKIRETEQAIRANMQAIRAAQADTANAAKINLSALHTYNMKAQALNNLRARYKELNPTIAEQRQEMSELLIKIQLLDKELKDIDASLGNFQRNVGNYRSALSGIAGLFPGTSAFAPLISGAGGATAAVAAVSTAITAMLSTIDRSKEAIMRMSALQKAIRAVSDSAEEANSNMQFLYAEADRLGLSVTDLSDSFKSFIASAKGSTLQGAQAREVFGAVSAAAAALGLSADQTSRALTALGQMLSKGKVQSEELKGQLGEALPGAFNLAAKAMGVTTAELGKMLEKGEVLATDLLPKLAKVLQEEYGDAVNEAGLTGAINRLNNAFDNMFTNIGARLEPFLKSSYDRLADFVTRVAELFETEEQEIRRLSGQRAKEFLKQTEFEGKNLLRLQTELLSVEQKLKEAKGEQYAELKKQAEALKKQIIPQVEKLTDEFYRAHDAVKEYEERLKKAEQASFFDVNRFAERSISSELLKNAKAREQALSQLLQEYGQLRMNAIKSEVEKRAQTEKEAAEKAKKAAEKAEKERAETLKKLRLDYEKWLEDYNTRINFIDYGSLQKEFQKALEDLQKEWADLEKRQKAIKLPISVKVELPDEEIAESPFSFINVAGDLQQFDDFFAFQKAVIDNNKAVADSFLQIGRQIESVFGENVFTRFLQQAVQGYQAFLKLQELQIDLRKKDIAATNAQTAANLKQAGAQGAAAVTKTAAQTGVGAIAAVPATLAVISTAIALIKAIFAGFEEGTEFLGKDNPTAPLGKDAIPIIAAKGERIIPYRLNKQLGNVTNEELVKYARIGMLQGTGLRDVVKAAQPSSEVSLAVSAAEIGKAVANEIKHLPIAVNVWDEEGYHAHTAKINKLRKVNRKWFA